MKTKKLKWYEILRKNGLKQYATKTKGGYLLYGDGFIIKKFDAVSVTPIDSVPSFYEKGIAHICDGKYRYKAICNINNFWNGWALPCIHNSEIEKFIFDFSTDIYMEYDIKLENDILFIKDVETYNKDDYGYKIEPINVEGETYYFLGDLGWTWEFETKTECN